VIDVFAEQRGHDSTGDPLGRDIAAREIAGDAGMACMDAEIETRRNVPDASGRCLANLTNSGAVFWYHARSASDVAFDGDKMWRCACERTQAQDQGARFRRSCIGAQQNSWTRLGRRSQWHGNC
jgi:hypothetical protein